MSFLLNKNIFFLLKGLSPEDGIDRPVESKGRGVEYIDECAPSASLHINIHFFVNNQRKGSSISFFKT